MAMTNTRYSGPVDKTYANSSVDPKGTLRDISTASVSGEM